jgi:class 3 adenylate cyclase/predicted ATPase
MDLGAWLRGLGLEQYESAFRDNAIDDSVLLSLTAEDLKDLGVGIVGHRRKLLDAIAAMRVDANAAPAATAPPIEGAAKHFVEHRQVTVMFSDLVGSTALSARIDAEDLRDVISAYRNCATAVVRRFGGFVAKYMGDGILIYFGYPQAHEDDAERAVRAGLELVAAVSALKSRVVLQTRVGIATGLVVVGDLFGSGESQERGIVGEAPNLAARLQEIAKPNTVVIADGTGRLLGNLFELEALEVQGLKGIAGPVRAWSALRARSVESRFDAMHAGGFTALVGRQEELELLLRRWSKVKSGEGQVVLLSGEAGIGKSRITAALLEHLAGEPHTRLRYFCSPQHTDSALYPIISQFERAAGLTHEDAPHAKLDKLDAMLALAATARQDAALFAEMLSLPNDGRYPALELDPQQRRQKTLEALGCQLEALARLNPVLMVFEDSHWTDPTSLEAFGRTIERIESLRVLLVVTHRPEFQPPWIGRPHVTTLTLNRLARREIDDMIDRVAGNKRLPAHIRNDIIERTDGIPLFVEEMTKAVLEAGSESAAEHIVARAPSLGHEVPASLHATLMARLDRLGEAKEVAQIGAAIGREFSHALLAAVVRRPEAELHAALERLMQSGLVFKQGMPPHANYLFKHALVQDAAYGTLLRETRRMLHARIADSLEHSFAEVAESQPELLARHYTEAGSIEKAVALWDKAAQRSLARSALVEAAEQLTRALSQIAMLPATPALRREEIKLQVALINPLFNVKGYAAQETTAAVERARLLIERAEALGEPPEDPLLLFAVLFGFWVANYVAFNGDVMRELAAQFLAIAEKQGATVPLMMGHQLMGISLASTGDFVGARAHHDQALARYDPDAHRPLGPRFSVEPRVQMLCFRSFALWMLGYPEAALADARQGLQHARENDDAVSLMFALFWVPGTHTWCGDYAAANALLDELLALSGQKGALFWEAHGLSLRGQVMTQSDDASAAAQMMTSAITAYRATGSTLWLPLCSAYLACANAELGQIGEAWRCIDEALTTIETAREWWFEAECNRLAGEIALKSPEPDAGKARAYFERALTVARAQQAKSWELRAATSMARLLRDQGKREQAHELLAPVYGWFSEGFATLDLKMANALLGELRSGQR